MASEGRRATVHYEAAGEMAQVEGLVNIEESSRLAAVRVRTQDAEQMIPWHRVVRVDYGSE